jgi:acid phosphatase
MKRVALRAALSICGIAAVAVIANAGAGTALASSGPCGTIKPRYANYTHVLWIMEENHSYDTIIGSPQAPYINSLASECGLASNYHNISHPSLPKLHRGYVRAAAVGVEPVCE